MMFDWTWSWPMGFGILFTVLFWGAIIALIVWLIVRLTRRENNDSGTEKHKPIDIARDNGGLNAQ